MLSRHLTLCGLLLTTPFVGLAQTTDSAPPRFYVGLSAYTSFYQQQSRKFGENILPPVQATFGYQLSPRLALQAAVAYNVGKGTYSGTAYGADGTSIGDYKSVYRNSALSVSALGRYTLTRTPSHRFQIDALGGFTLEHQTYHGSGFYPDNTQPMGSAIFNHSSQRNAYLLTLGPSLRYRVSPKVEVVGEGTVNVEIRGLQNISTSGSLGVRYRFGQ